jgi:DNA methylase
LQLRRTGEALSMIAQALARHKHLRKVTTGESVWGRVDLCGNEVAVATLGSITARKSFGSSAIRHPLAPISTQRQNSSARSRWIRPSCFGEAEPMRWLHTRDFTSRGDIVFDPFAGVGTTIFAADQWSRLLYRI